MLRRLSGAAQKLKKMTIEEKREQVILSIAEQLRHNPFTVKFQIVKKPKGIKIIHEVTREEMDALIKAAKGGEK